MQSGLIFLFIIPAVIVFIFLLILTEKNVKEKTKEAITKEYEAKMESLVMGQELLVSQIQPHFIYNVLNTIKYLCNRNPQEALTAIDCFSDFLRESMDSFNSTDCIPFLQEMEMVENYVYLEKLRFGDKVEIKVQLTVTEFYLPSLSVQPLVENAIKHGITKKLGGGTVWIKTREDEDNYYVEIIDNGVGFVLGSPPKNPAKSHIGIENTTNRIKTMCKGTLSIESEIDTMTKAIISIPKEV